MLSRRGTMRRCAATGPTSRGRTVSARGLNASRRYTRWADATHLLLWLVHRGAAYPFLRRPWRLITAVETPVGMTRRGRIACGALRGSDQQCALRLCDATRDARSRLRHAGVGIARGRGGIERCSAVLNPHCTTGRHRTRLGSAVRGQHAQHLVALMIRVLRQGDGCPQQQRGASPNSKQPARHASTHSRTPNRISC